MAALQRAAAMRDAGRDLHAPGLKVTHQEFHQLTFGRGLFARVIESDLDRADHVPPVGLKLVNVPCLDRSRIHQGMAPLPEVVEEAVRLADHFAEKSPLIRVCYQLLYFNAFDAHLRNHGWFAPRSRTKSCTA